MSVFNKKFFGRALCFLTALAVSMSLIVSCGVNGSSGDNDDKPVYVASDKNEILANVQNTINDDSVSLAYVADYLKLWGVGDFDYMKIAYFESCFASVYNYESVMPDKKSHAIDTASIFLEKYYDEIDRTDKTELTDSLLYCYAESLNDPYSVYRPPVKADDYTADMSGKFGGIGVVIEYNDYDKTIMVTTVYLDSPAEKAGIEVGDFIYAVDGVTVEELGHRNAVNYVRGEIGTEVELTLLRDGEFLTVSAVRAEVEELNVNYSFDESTKIGYVRIVSFKGNTFDQFKSSIDALESMGAVGFIFDVRGNPGGYLYSVCDVLSYIIPTGKTIVSYQYKGKGMTVLRSENDGDGINETADHVINVPIVVICNEYTASSGEIFAAAIRDYRNDKLLNATIVGTTTFKKGIMQNTYSYPADGSTVTLTVAYYNPPCGKNYHGVGVTPDVIAELPEPERDAETGEYLPVEDTQLKSALEELKTLLNAN